jgi:hypothetical protein
MRPHNKLNDWTRFRLSILATGALSWGSEGTAHHSFAAVFDARQTIELTGTVAKVEWTNPHTWFYIDVDNGDGDRERWALELGSPNNLIRRGWTRGSLRIGQIVNVAGYRARDGSLSAAVRQVTLASGQPLHGGQAPD